MSRALLLCSLLALAVSIAGPAMQAQTLTTLYNFSGGADGSRPTALLLDSQGNLYGTTYYGGAHSVGTVFKLTSSGTETVLHSFSFAKPAICFPPSGGPSALDGAVPNAGLLSDSQGNLYGTTANGGHCGSFGAVFKVSPSGSEQVLYKFTGAANGFGPSAGLSADAQGNLYGTTAFGGTSSQGTIFKVTPTGTQTVLHSLTGSDGGTPRGRVIFDSQGNLYGTAVGGGAHSCGTVFKLTPSGTLTVLYNFNNTGNDGCFPVSGLVSDSQGNLYGVTDSGGSCAIGTVFEVTPTGSETVLHSFCGGSDGVAPDGDLILDSLGNLYGTTSVGGAFNRGTVFKLTLSGVETVLHSFSGPDGFEPTASLTLDAAGNLYGATQFGGSFSSGCNNNGCGSVFKITP